MRFIGEAAQAVLVGRIQSGDPGSCLVVPVDVGKRRAATLVAGVLGQVLEGSFGFALDETGLAELDRRIGVTVGKTRRSRMTVVGIGVLAGRTSR